MVKDRDSQEYLWDACTCHPLSRRCRSQLNPMKSSSWFMETPPHHPLSHPRLLELDHEGAAGVQYSFAIKLNRPKVFQDNASPCRSIYGRGKIFRPGAVPMLFSWLHTLKNCGVCVCFYFLFSLLKWPFCNSCLWLISWCSLSPWKWFSFARTL